ncbi:MAG: hypothetical protein GTO30_08510, partial [Acidobacteria bacterium]|nr:hypothetical protein [Acidobacteriota bacterium]NIQ84089.1 hypothetical protein [Acidobacteriota bacterium]
ALIRVLIAVLILCAAPLWASSGVVIDPKGQPLEGVSACYSVGGTDALCVSSDESGRWVLPKSSIDAIRLTLSGYLPKEIRGGDHPEPIILDLAATLLVKLQTTAGEPVVEGEFDLVYTSGKKLGPFPISRADGTRIRSLRPGPVVIVGRSDGYADGRASES